MTKRIIYITQTRFNLRDYQRFGIELLKANGFEVEVWELTSILHPGLSKKYTPPDVFSYDGLFLFTEKGHAYDKLSSLLNGDFVVNFLHYSFETLWAYRALSKSSAGYAVFCANALPSPVIKQNWFPALLKKTVSFRHIGTWKRLFMRLPLRLLGVRPAVLILAGGTECRFNYHYPVDKNTEVLSIHAMDYDLYLKARGVPFQDRPMAVFLDESLSFHPDQVILGGDGPLNKNRYHEALNHFFDVVEQKTGFEVIIAVHPRSNYENLNDYFKGRKRIRGDTINLVKECRLVLAHSSTALNFANLFYKPVIFITCSDLDITNEHHNINEMAKWFGKRPVYADKDTDIDFEGELKINRVYYDNYRRSYIKKDGIEDLPFWQIFANRLKKGFGKQIMQGKGEHEK